ncbi:MAG: septum formation protein Maf [Acidobacteriaceae bacterium]|nr:septum formation protein Maf [Acidobacteriaceae bacterium]MBV9502630.1 septum formation protein Maf [Acidobacteriaceae bacterium]
MLILASASPRRHELLLAAGIPHVVRPAAIPEERQGGESPASFVKRLAEEKARSIPRQTGDVVLGADTAVCLEEAIFGKPSDLEDASRMLRALSGRTHSVYTGICLLSDRRLIVDSALTYVTFAPLSDNEIKDYTRSGEPLDKAGAYAVQGLASKFVLSIEGCYQNVVGLPVSLVYHHLKSL